MQELPQICVVLLLKQTCKCQLLKTHYLKKLTIAEFVESEQVAEKLREIGIDYYQGYFIAKPKPIEELAYGDRAVGLGNPVDSVAELRHLRLVPAAKADLPPSGIPSIAT